MSKIKVQSPVQNPIIHLPSYKTWGVDRYYFVSKLKALGIEPFPADKDIILAQWYYYTDAEGWSKLLPDLVLKSSLYQPNKFKCVQYAWLAWLNCIQRYGLNSLCPCIDKNVAGDTQRAHAYNIFPIGDATGIQDLMLFEPNEGYEYSGSAILIGAEGYIPELVFV